METRANYVIVGIFTLASILAAFGFIYWTAAIGDRGETVLLRVRIPGSASGLGRGSAVLFNGVKVGDVQRVYIDVTNPAVAIADTQIDRVTPITRSTSAVIGIAGLTGQANIEVKGSNSQEPNLLAEAEAAGTVAEITADPSAVTNLLQRAQDIFARADSVLSEVEGFTRDVRGPLTATVKNTQTFSDALARNADGIDRFLDSVSKLSVEIAGVSGKLESTLTAADNILKAVDPGQVRDVVANVETFTRDLSKTSGQLDEVVRGVREAVTTYGDVGKTAQASLGKVNGILDGVDPATVRNAITNIDQVSRNANAIASDVAKVTDKIGRRADEIDRMLADASQLAGRLNDASAQATDVVQGARVAVDTFAQVGKTSQTALDKVTGILDGVDPAKVRDALSNIEQASRTANAATTDIAKVTQKIGNRADDIDRIVGDAGELTKRLNAASVRVDGILLKVDNLLGSGQAEGLAADARETLKSFKQVADTLNSRLGVITDNLARFSGQGLRNAESLIDDSRRSINRIEQTITDLGRNPQRIITGGDGAVRQFDGRRRR